MAIEEPIYAVSLHEGAYELQLDFTGRYDDLCRFVCALPHGGHPQQGRIEAANGHI